MSELDCSCNRLREAQEKAAKWDAIVRCGECVQLDVFGEEEPNYWCDWFSAHVRPNSFCAWGERREV